MANNENDTYSYTYCAKEQEEIKAIRKKYAAPEENKLEQLRRLDAGVTQKASAVSLAFGIIGALILGLGMSLFMSDFGKLLGAFNMPFGIIIGVTGIAIMCAAYPIYSFIIQKERKKIAPEILRLTDELMK